jgi:transposase
MNVHKNARLTPQGRVLLVRRITEEGWRIVDAANAAGISVRQSYRWLARYRSGGAAALADRSSARPSASMALVLTGSAKSRACGSSG